MQSLFTILKPCILSNDIAMAHGTKRSNKCGHIAYAETFKCYRKIKWRNRASGKLLTRESHRERITSKQAHKRNQSKTPFPDTQSVLLGHTDQKACDMWPSISYQSNALQVHWLSAFFFLNVCFFLSPCHRSIVRAVFVGLINM